MMHRSRSYGSLESHGSSLSLKAKYHKVGRPLVHDSCQQGRDFDHRRSSFAKQILRKWRSKHREAFTLKTMMPYVLIPVWAAVLIAFDVRLGVDVMFPNEGLALFTGLLSFLLALRCNQAYERWNEGRRLWGTMTHQCICFTNQMNNWAANEAVRTRALRFTIAFPVAVKQTLRNQSMKKRELKEILYPGEVTKFNTYEGWMPLFAIYVMRRCISLSNEAGTMSDAAVTSCDAVIRGLVEGMSDMIRIRNSPVPIVYASLLSLLKWTYLLLMPMAMADKLEWATVPVALLVGILYNGLSNNASALEDPFGEDLTQLNLELFCRIIEQQCTCIAALGGEDKSLDEDDPRDAFSYNTPDIEGIGEPDGNDEREAAKRPSWVLGMDDEEDSIMTQALLRQSSHLTR
ncbi:unnamed protein product [Chrysoparadoxa australica]